MQFAETLDTAQQIIVNFGLKLLGAFALWWAGRWLIGVAARLIQRALTMRQVDPTLQRYMASILSVVLNIVLVIGILGFFGFETTSFAALLAAAGVAIGAAWSGLLSNFASGAFLMVLRPFKVGDYISGGGVEGTVREIGLFATTILTPDNVVTLVGNGKLLADNLKNFSAAPYRRVDRVAQIDHGVDPADAIARLKARLSSIPNVMAEPAPDVEILDFNPMGAQLAVRPYCHTDHYWQVYFDTNRVIREEFSQAGYGVPSVHQVHVAAPPRGL
ncbi:MAG: mechanosensitive ion channel family protein [Burkholderiales bacterium]|jgi:small conductance mechanosensitive channel